MECVLFLQLFVLEKNNQGNDVIVYNHTAVVLHAAAVCPVSLLFSSSSLSLSLSLSLLFVLVFRSHRTEPNDITTDPRPSSRFRAVISLVVEFPPDLPQSLSLPNVPPFFSSLLPRFFSSLRSLFPPSLSSSPSLPPPFLFRKTFSAAPQILLLPSPTPQRNSLSLPNPTPAPLLDRHGPPGH